MNNYIARRAKMFITFGIDNNLNLMLTFEDAITDYC